jgi:LAO/AO transport system kinase
MTREPIPIEAYVSGIRGGDRALLARAITLVESSAADDRDRAEKLLAALLPEPATSLRIGVTGAPGAGKSTLIEALGTYLTAADHRVAVTAVDPTSDISGGSVLGDKTRMSRLAADPRAFVRPSPSAGGRGGVAMRTREIVSLFEAAGFDIVIVETVGVGQSETAVRSLVDFFLLMMVTGGGDELQAIKRGVGELADAVLINKADGENRARAEAARADYARALDYLQPATEGWATRTLVASALHSEGIAELWDVIVAFRDNGARTGTLEERRRAQAWAWVRRIVDDTLRDRFYGAASIQALLPDLERAVKAGETTPIAAARELLVTAR